MSDAVLCILKYYALMWTNSIKMEKTIGRMTRLSFAFPDVGRFGEALCSAITGYKGCGSKGSGADLTDGIKQKEVKTVCLCQPSVCNSCKRRSPWSDIVCSHCGDSKLVSLSDSRFGIGTTAHIKNKNTLDDYMCVAIEPTEADDFRITVWKIDATNEYFNKYIDTQDKHKSKTCNLLPHSFDFAMSAPVRVFQVTLTLPSDGDAHPTVGAINAEEYHEKVRWDILTGNERKLVCIEKGGEISVEDASKILTARKKSHGKPRGDTSRSL